MRARARIRHHHLPGSPRCAGSTPAARLEAQIAARSNGALYAMRVRPRVTASSPGNTTGHDGVPASCSWPRPCTATAPGLHPTPGSTRVCHNTNPAVSVTPTSTTRGSTNPVVSTSTMTAAPGRHSHAARARVHHEHTHPDNTPPAPPQGPDMAAP